MAPVDVVVAGHLCLDLHPEMENVSLDELPTPGHLFETGKLTVATGGAVSNTGLALHKLGANVRLMARLGDDFIGDAILHILEKYDPSLKQDIRVIPGLSSSYTIVLTPGSVDRIFLHGTGTNTTFGFADIRFEVLREAKVFHLGYPSLLPRLYANNGEELLATCRQAKEAGAVTSVDLTLPDPNAASGQVNWREIFPRVMPYIDVFIPSIEEIVFCLRRSEYDGWHGNVIPHLNATYLNDLADELLDMGGVIVGFKLGQFGFFIKTAALPSFDRLTRLELDSENWANAAVWSPAFQVEVAGTTGAGDSAYAGFLASLLRKHSPQDAVRFACAVGGCNVEAVDSLSGVRSWTEIQQRLNTGWLVRSERLPGF